MSTQSALVLFRKNLPSAKEIEDLIRESGTLIKFESGFDFDKSPDKYVEVECDGQKSAFSYSIFPISEFSEEDFEEFPKSIKNYGDTVLSFVTHGLLAGEIVYLIEKTIAKKAKATACIDGELISTADFTAEIPINDDLPPEIAAKLRGSPSERAAAHQAYIDLHYPKVDLIPNTQNPVKVWFNDNNIEIITVVVVVLGIIIYILVRGFLKE